MDGISIGGPITAMQKCVFPVGTQADGTSVANRYQTAYNLAADCWSGYFGQNNNWAVLITSTFPQGWLGSIVLYRVLLYCCTFVARLKG